MLSILLGNSQILSASFPLVFYIAYIVCSLIIASPRPPLYVNYVIKQSSDFQDKAAAMKYLSFGDTLQIEKTETNHRQCVLLCLHTKGYFSYFQSIIVEIYSFSSI